MRPAPAALMLYAAGLGRRMLPLTADRPKPLVRVAGRALIDHALDLVPPGLRIVANSHYHGAQIRQHLQGHQMLGRPVLIHHEEQLLDTGGGLKAALPLLAADPVYTMNTDAILTGPSSGPDPLAQLAAAWDPDRMDALLLVVPPARALGHAGPGDFRLGTDGRLSRGPAITPDCIYTGLQIITPKLLDGVEETVFSNNMLWDIAAQRGRLCGITHPGHWCDVGRPQSIALAEALLAESPRAHG